MKKSILLFSLCVIAAISAFPQITVTKTEGSSIIIDLGTGYKINEGSTLKKEKIILNDALCPIQLKDDVGIEIIYAAKFLFKPSGNFNIMEPIVAYEFHHILYNVFGDHIKTLSNTEVADLEGLQVFNQDASWYASINDVNEYLISVSYVANVRTKSGQLWHYNFIAIKKQLDTLRIAFEESYIPKKDNEK